MKQRLLTMTLLAAAPPAWAQQAQPVEPAAQPADEGDAEAESEEVVVTGQRERGSVAGDIPPVQQLRPADIRSYGVGTVNELLAELGPQTRSGRGGPPVVLLNGRRISGFQEIRDLPTEAIARVDILPEEVALRYGFRADQRVVNFVLRRRFRSTTVELADRIATEGGRNQLEADLGLLQIRGDDRVNLALEAQSSGALLETERDIVSRFGTGEQDPFRSLLPENRTIDLNAVYARPIGRVAATVNGQLQVNDTEALLGRAGVEGFGLGQSSRQITGRLATTLNGDAGRWRWTFTGAYDRVASETFTDIEGANPNRAESTFSTGAANLLLSGPAFALPAGDVSATVRVGGSTSDFESRSFRFGTTTDGQVSRDLGSAQASVDVPIASRSRDVLAGLGQLSLNFNLGAEELSDFGTLTRYGYGANWSPLEGVRVIASMQVDEDAPSAQQLGDPNIVTPGARVFDYLTGETALVTSVTGGNPDLSASRRRASRLGLNLRPWSDKDLSIQADYNRVRTDDPVVGFPAATAAIAQAFPGRFTRDAEGRLTALDARPINFARQERSEVRYGFNFSKPLKSRVQRQLEAFRAGTGPNPFAGIEPSRRFRERQGGEGRGDRGRGEAQAGAAPGDGGPGGGRRGGGRFGGGGGQGGGRLQVALFHTVNLTNSVLVAQGGPSLDLLGGDAIGNNGGQPRHEIEGQAGYTNNGLGARLSVNYRSGTEVAGGTAGTPEPLEFGSLTTLNLRLFADLGQRIDWVRRNPWMRGVRLAVAVTNLLNQRQRVEDAAGVTPVNFQPGLLDPLGRSVRISVRKLFF
jgi:uncharacterized membrane protein YgcG